MTTVRSPKSRRQQVEEAEQAEVLKDRRSIAAMVARLKAEHLEALTPLLEAEEDAQAEVNRSEAALKAAVQQREEAQVAHMNASGPYARELGRLERALLLGAPPEIDAFVKEMRSLYEKVGCPDPNYRGPDPYFPSYREDVQAQQEAQERRKDRMERIRQAIGQAESLKLEALDPAELTERLDLLRRSTDALRRSTEEGQIAFAAKQRERGDGHQPGISQPAAGVIV